MHSRKLQHGEGRLFGALGSKERVCKDYDEICTEAGLSDILIKDHRRAFINRNKYCVAHVDMVKIVGQSSLLDAGNVTASEKNVQEAVGHTGIGTTAGYATPRLAELANVFTSTSRWSRVAALMQPEARDTGESTVDPSNVEALQRVLADTLARLERAGVTAQV